MNTQTRLPAIPASSMEDRIFRDLAAFYALGPVYRFSFDIGDNAAEALRKRFAEFIFRAYRWTSGEALMWTEILFRFDDQSYAHVQNHYNKEVVLFCRTQERAEALEKEIRAALPPAPRDVEPFFYMVRYSDCCFSTEKVVNKASSFDEIALGLCYGSDAHEWMAGFGRESAGKAGGITILDGPPGTGKSTLITQLMRRLAETHVFYVLPVSQHCTLSRPELVNFWQQQNQLHPKHVKVIVMEDAEKILVQRRTDNNEAVSALLNIADGLMGQMLRVHVLCTLNQDMDQIDPAILRPGRLRCYRNVGLLTRESAVRLAAHQKLPFVPDPLREHYSLAEVFHAKVYKPKSPRRMGFHVQRN